MGKGHKTVKYQFNDDGSPAPRPVAVAAPVSEADNDPAEDEPEDLTVFTVADLRERAENSGISTGGMLKAEIIDALEDDEDEDDSGGDGYSTGTATDYGSTSEGYPS